MGSPTAGMPATSGTRRRAGRPRGELLNRSRIGAATLQFVGENGYDALTMSALATALGVSTSALYNHVESKQDLIQLVQDLVMERVDCSGFATRPLKEALRAWAVSYRNVFAEHTPLVPVIALMPVAGSPRTLQMYEQVAVGFTRAGWEDCRIVPAIVAMESFIFGSALDAVSPKDVFDVGIAPHEVPAFSSAVDAQRATGADPAQEAFEYGLAAIIEGLAGHQAC